MTRSARLELSAEGTHSDAFSNRDWFLLALPGIIWGTSFAFIAEALAQGIKPGLVTFLRISIGCATLALFPAARAKVDRADWGRITLLSVTWLAFPFTLFPLAQERVSSSIAGLLNGAIPLFAAVMATIALRRLPGRNQQAGLLVGLIGVACIGLPTLSEGRSSAIGVLMVLAAVASYGVAINLNVPLVHRYGPAAVFWRAQIAAVVMTAPFGLGSVAGSSLTLRGLGAVAVLGVFSTAIAFVLMSQLSARVGGTRASVTTYIEAVVALGLGVWWKGDEITAVQVIGCVILLAGAGLASRRDNRAAPSSPVVDDVLAAHA
jgi:drug/metabolite transporter (DMT)-like permease